MKLKCITEINDFKGFPAGDGMESASLGESEAVVGVM